MLKNDGWKFVATIPAKQVEQHALDNEKTTIFAKDFNATLQS